MISRKDNILKRPYEEKRFANHRRKVRSALPAIDNRPPDSRNHVYLKSKKQLQERDRIDKIQRNNFILLQKLKNVKKNCRVDHYWSHPLPQMVKNKVALYDTFMPNIIDFEVHDENDNEMEEIERRLEELGIRKSKCNACSPKKNNEPKIPEKRIPWEMEKEILIQRNRSKSLPSRKINLPIIKQFDNQKLKTDYRRIKSSISRENNHINDLDDDIQNRRIFNTTSPRRIILSRGCLNLSVNFPIDALVTLEDGVQNKLITGGLCHCKNLPVGSAV